MAEKSNRRKALIAASVAGILAVAGTIAAPAAHAEGVECWGVNKCKGQGECGGKGHSCAGQNGCKGQGWVTAKDADTCTKVMGGSLQSTEK